MVWKADANRIGAIIENHGGCGRFTFQNRRGVDGDFLGSKTSARGNGGIHLVRHRRAADGVFDPVQNVDDRVRVPPDLDFVDGFRDARRGFIQELAVLRKKFDHDGLGRARQVTDHVLQELNELHFGAGLGGFNFGSDIGDDVVNVALAIFLQPDGEISVVRFGDGNQPQLQSCAARSVLDFGRGLQNLFNVQKDAIGFGKRAARRREVVQDKPTLIHCWEEVRAEKPVTQYRKSNDQDRACG